ncbi:hypothetical protein BOTBODRAFT_45381 [Botryobasidium botryosum FD-172 SS1]|uniref:Aromatic amino acid beta-eliminating lyase/threonine aldolase domain-containing protein n=1 Tax=Botryobasidium botryosum (strain FD-172 SS1) TaxID=930990 RepID=A0A067MBQ5_BOTB1|nr:hypothetical protein BOTBODRAFT_45381 [Botryobasidium botryosum FD-172 SS1]
MPSLVFPPSPAAFDFRSDTITTPTPDMVEAMATASFGDDVFREDATTQALEARISAMLSHKAGLFVPSGTMSNQLAMRVHLLQPPHSVLCDFRAHLAQYEAGGVASLSGAMLQRVVPQNGRYLTVEDIQKAAFIDDGGVHSAPTRVISLENTLGGVITPLEEVRRIREFARKHGIKLHLDGARLWNVAVAGAGTLEEYGSLCDSVSVCFSKGLGAPIGSCLVGSEEFTKRARWVRQSIGGGMRQTGLIAAAALTALDQVYPKLSATHDIAKDLAQHFAGLGVKTTLPVDTSMVFLDIQGAGLQMSWLKEAATKRGVRFGSAGRIVVHHQIDPRAVQALKDTFSEVVDLKAKGFYKGGDGGDVGGYGGMARL